MSAELEIAATQDPRTWLYLVLCVDDDPAATWLVHRSELGWLGPAMLAGVPRAVETPEQERVRLVARASRSRELAVGAPS